MSGTDQRKGTAADPRVALRQGDVAERAAAARELAQAGTWEDLSELVTLAKEDNSPSVRLYTAAAAADIVCRMRSHGPALTSEQRTLVSDWVKTFDPGHNPSLLMMLSAVADGPTVDRLGRMLKDPRNGVRAGAAAALRRMALSAVSVDDTRIPMAVDKLLAQVRRLPGDAVLELVRLVGEAGWAELEDALGPASGAGRLHGPAAEEALERLRARREPSTWEGLWLADGGDVLEPVPERTIASWLAVVDGVAVDASGELGPIELREGRGALRRRPVRLIFTPRVGESGIFRALQSEGTTWYLAEGKELLDAVETLVHDVPQGVARGMFRWLEGLEGVQAQRARALALWRAGDLAGAAALLTEQVEQKKPKADLFWFLARVRADQGDRAGAVAALDAFLERAGKRARFRKEAETLRAELA